MRIKSLAAGLAGAAFCGASLGATLSPVADTWVESDATSDFSTNANMLVKVQGNDLNDRVALLRFDGSAITETVASAGLDVVITSISGAPANWTFQLFAVPDGGANEVFDAATVTFDNFGYLADNDPNNVIDANLAGGVPLASVTITNTAAVGNVLSFTSTDLVNFLNANTSTAALSFLITSSTQTDSAFIAFGSQDNTTVSNRPLLNYEVVPEPASLALVGLGAMCLFGRRRREVA